MLTIGLYFNVFMVGISTSSWSGYKAAAFLREITGLNLDPVFSSSASRDSAGIQRKTVNLR
jgi:hypothetical protein